MAEDSEVVQFLLEELNMTNREAAIDLASKLESRDVDITTRAELFLLKEEDMQTLGFSLKAKRKLLQPKEAAGAVKEAVGAASAPANKKPRSESFTTLEAWNLFDDENSPTDFKEYSRGDGEERLLKFSSFSYQIIITIFDIVIIIIIFNIVIINIIIIIIVIIIFNHYYYVYYYYYFMLMFSFMFIIRMSVSAKLVSTMPWHCTSLWHVMNR
jgi:hypothetical protein